MFRDMSPKEAADKLGLSLSMIYKWAEPPEQRSGAANPLDRVASLLECSGDTRIVDWICQRADGFFIKNPKAAPLHPDSLVPAMNHVVQEFADLLAVMAAAGEDNQITVAEAKSIRARWENLKSVTEEFVHCCEKGNFREISKAASAKIRAPKPH